MTNKKDKPTPKAPQNQPDPVVEPMKKYNEAAAGVLIFLQKEGFTLAEAAGVLDITGQLMQRRMKQVMDQSSVLEDDNNGKED
jgi:hypothetical protein